MWQINHPAYWWALFALAIPIVIHLYNRRLTKVKVLGTLRWLNEVQTAQWSFRRLHQWPLLLIRLMLFTLVVLLLIDLHETNNSGTPKKLHTLILIHPAVGDTNQYRQLAAGWKNDTVNIRWLAPGFPVATEQINQWSNHLWSLVAEADMRFQPDSIHIIAPNQQAYFTGTPPYTSAALSWELIDIPEDSIRLLWARELPNEPELLWFRTHAEMSEYSLQEGLENTDTEQSQVTYSTDKKSIEVKKGAHLYQVPLSSPDTLTIAASVNEDTADEWQIFQKSVRAVAQYQKVPVKFVEENDTTADWLLVLDKEIAGPSKANATLLVWHYEPNKSAAWLEPTKPHTLLIRKELTTSQVLDGGFLQALRPYILAFKYKKVVLPQADYRKVELAAGNWSRENSPLPTLAEPLQQTASHERTWLGILTFLVLTLERLWPKKNR